MTSGRAPTLSGAQRRVRLRTDSEPLSARPVAGTVLHTLCHTLRHTLRHTISYTFRRALGPAPRLAQIGPD